MKQRLRCPEIGLALALVMVLAGCNPPADDLEAWMAGQRQRQQPRPVPAVQAVASEPLRYEPGTREDPFDAGRLSMPRNAPRDDGLAPDLRRAREPLESYPLGSLRLVGSLRRGPEVVALVEADRLIHQVRVGNHLGQDFGRVVAIGDNGIDIDELVREGGDAWIRRRARLQLRENR